MERNKSGTFYTCLLCLALVGKENDSYFLPDLKIDCMQRFFFVTHFCDTPSVRKYLENPKLWKYGFKVPGPIASDFPKTFGDFGIRRNLIFFSLPLVNFTAEKRTVWKILMKM